MLAGMSADPPSAKEKSGSAAAPRARRTLWPALVGVAAVLAVLFAWKHHAIAAWWSGEPRPQVTRAPAPPVPAPAWAIDHANALRQEGFTACKQRLWALCEDKLDAASYLDPQGDAAEAVRLARQAAYEGLHPDASGSKERAPSPPPPSATAARSRGSSG